MNVDYINDSLDHLVFSFFIIWIERNCHNVVNEVVIVLASSNQTVLLRLLCCKVLQDNAELSFVETTGVLLFIAKLCFRVTQFTFVRIGCNLNCILFYPKVDAALLHQLLLCLIFLNVKSQVE